MFIFNNEEWTDLNSCLTISFFGVGCDSCLICLHNHHHHGSFYLINLGPVFGIIFFLVPFRQSIQIVLGRMVRSIVLNFDRCFIHCSSIFTYIQFWRMPLIYYNHHGGCTVSKLWWILILWNFSVGKEICPLLGFYPLQCLASVLFLPV